MEPSVEETTVQKTGREKETTDVVRQPVSHQPSEFPVRFGKFPELHRHRAETVKGLSDFWSCLPLILCLHTYRDLSTAWGVS